MPLAIGTKTTDFVLTDQFGQTKSRSELAAGKSLMVVFFPFAFSGICAGELTGFRDQLADFETDNCTLVAVSCDPMYALRAFADQEAIFFPLLSDFWPHGSVSSEFKAFDPSKGMATRHSYLLNPAGEVVWVTEVELGQARDLQIHADAVRNFTLG